MILSWPCKVNATFISFLNPAPSSVTTCVRLEMAGADILLSLVSSGSPLSGGISYDDCAKV